MRKRRAPVRVAVGTLCVLGVLATAPLPAGARAGDLDPSFGTGGTVNVNTGTDVPDLLVQKPLKKYLVLLGDYVTQRHFGVTRLNLNGSLDTTFGT